MSGSVQLSRRTSRGGVSRALFVPALAALSMVCLALPAHAAVGTVTSWGSNASGQLGIGNTVDHLTVVAVPAAGTVTQIAGGRDFAFALMTDGTVESWGSNDNGQLGIGTTTNRSTPGAVIGWPASTTTPIVEIAAGHYHSLALDSAGKVYAWGRNTNGQLGDGTLSRRTRPVQAGLTTALPPVRELAGGRDHSLALTTTGTVWAWGSNAFGQVGDGTTTRRLRPVPVPGLTDVVAIAAGREHSLALESDGTLWAWGSNVYGQLGDGTKVNRTSPVRITNAAGMFSGIAGTVTDVKAGAHHSLALLSNGTVAAWGRNYRAEVGDGTITTRLLPKRVVGIGDQAGQPVAASIGTGRDHCLVVMSDGTIRAWGYNVGGQLGDGTVITRRAPVTVVGVTDAQEAEGGGDYSIAMVG